MVFEKNFYSAHYIYFNVKISPPHCGKFTPENHELNKLESTLGGSFYISFSFFGEIVFLNEDLKKKIFSLSIPIITDNFMNKTAIVVHSTPRILI